MTLRRVSLLALLLAFAPAAAFTADPKAPQPTQEQVQSYLKQQLNKLHPQHGKIQLEGGIATLNLPEDLGYLPPDEADVLIHNIWGNPPGGAKTLGAIIPMKINITSSDSWGVIITYAKDGYVKDDEAESINYEEMLGHMKEANKEENEKRAQQGYPGIELVGWAEKPHYDKTTHKLYWAREFLAGGGKERDVNYDIRILGRAGVLAMSVVGGMDQLPMIRKAGERILSYVDFNPTHRYADFNPDTDKVAVYGMAAMVAGFALAKAGFFKVLLVGLLAFKKFILLGLFALMAFCKKLFGRK